MKTKTTKRAKRNQCDGCARGLKLRGDIHVTDRGLAVQACTKSLYLGNKTKGLK